MYNLKKKYGSTALVTGASSGIGKQFATVLAKEGLNLILVARREQALNDLASELSKQYGIEVQVIASDLSRMDAVAALVAQLKWPVDVLVNNAGFASYGRFDTLEQKVEENMVDLNCRHVVSLTHALLPHMIENKRGAVICLASVVSHMAAPYMATYSASKAFNRFFALSLAAELKIHNIDVLALCPGDTVSEFRETASFDKAMPLPARSAAQVVHTAFKSLGKKASVTDGPWNKFFVFFTRNWFEKRVLLFSEKAWRPRKKSAA